MMVCTVRLKILLRSSLRSREKRIGTGMPRMILLKLMISVLRSARRNSGEYIRRRKFFSPTQSLPQMPFMMRYFLNAMMMPYMGA